MKSTKETRALAYDILAYWERFNHHEQSNWVEADSVYHLNLTTEKIGSVEVNVCNTSMCAAGTAVFLGMKLKDFKHFVEVGSDSNWEDNGARLLGLDEEEAMLVFYSDNDSAKRYMRAIARGSQKKFDQATEKRSTL